MYMSPTHGLLPLDQVFLKAKEYIMSNQDSEYHVMIGCDSQQHKSTLILVSVIMVHRVGHGAIYFYEKTPIRKPSVSVREKMYTETSKSLEVALAFKHDVLESEDLPVDITIHLDIGKTGKTSEYIKELVGYVESCGFEACFKDTARLEDSSYIYPVAASTVADRHSK